MKNFKFHHPKVYHVQLSFKCFKRIDATFKGLSMAEGILEMETNYRLSQKCIKQRIRIKQIVIFQDFHSTKRSLRLVDSWSCAPDQIQKYPDRDTIPQLMPAPDVLLLLLNEKSKYMTAPRARFFIHNSGIRMVGTEC